MASAERLVAGEDCEASDQDDEWFGNGGYFWEHAFKQAWWWAESHKKHPVLAVIGTVSNTCSRSFWASSSSA